MATRRKDLKTNKFDMRLTEEQERIIRLAAELKHKTPTSFILEKACEAAEEVILEQRRFVLNEKQWAAFNAALEAPPKVLPKLRKIMSEKQEWEKA